MTEEARAAMMAAIHEMGRALAIEHRLPEPVQRPSARLRRRWTRSGRAARRCWWPCARFWPTNTRRVQPAIAALGQPVETGARQAKDFFAGIKAKLATIGD